MRGGLTHQTQVLVQRLVHGIVDPVPVVELLHFFEAVDGGDVRVLERGQGAGLVAEAGQAVTLWWAKVLPIMRSCRSSGVRCQTFGLAGPGATEKGT